MALSARFFSSPFMQETPHICGVLSFLSGASIAPLPALWQVLVLAVRIVYTAGQLQSGSFRLRTPAFPSTISRRVLWIHRTNRLT